MVPEVRDRSYENRLAALNLWTLEERRNRADLIELFRMKQGISGLVFEDYFELDCSGRTRGHSCKLRKDRSNRDLRRCFFFTEGGQPMEQVVRGHCFCNVREFVQEQIESGEKKKDGPVLGLNVCWVLEAFPTW